MASRAVIEQAKGVIVAQRGRTTAEAFEILVRASQAANRKLRDIAEGLVQKRRASASSVRVVMAARGSAPDVRPADLSEHISLAPSSRTSR